MEQIAELIKTFILTNVNAELPGLASTGVTLPAIDTKNVVFGTVDLSRYEAPVLVSILPDTESMGEGYIDGAEIQHDLTITFLFQKATYSVLVKRMMRYVRAFQLALEKNEDFSGQVRSTLVEEIRFYPDTGATPQQMTAFEIQFNVVTEDSVVD